MPHIRVRAIEPEHLRACSRSLIDRLQTAIGCDRSWFTLEHVPTRFFSDGEEVHANPFVEVLWFPRDATVKTVVATILAEELRGDAAYVTVVFFDLAQGDYFENGQPV